ncbi:Hypothetical predicted protein [Olea europaea subsp. europaea]|uniref:Uncharacterized protein n=1 Tax=Olea europaea subsp. europaea TaxID=158383 RepID=A0A8S0T085_OLEEU|nr:Hypothetical predicted protein [Olea europaea subsp. europaea]
MNNVAVAMLMPLQRSDLYTLLQRGNNATTLQAPIFVHYNTRCALSPVGGGADSGGGGGVVVRCHTVRLVPMVV